MRVLIYGFAMATLMGVAQAQTCMQQVETPEPEMVMGTLVQRQSDVMVVGDCDKTAVENTEAYVAADKKGTSDFEGFVGAATCTTQGTLESGITSSCVSASGYVGGH